jgi:hypothetical protein
MMKRFTYIFGFVMAAIMVMSVILPAISPRSTQPTTQDVVEPTALPTFPPPPEPSTISFDQTYLHPSGLFTVAEPTGWLPSQPETTRDSARAVFSNGAAQSIIQVDVNEPVEPAAAPLTLDDVDARYNTSWLASSWREYSSWDESSRERTADDRLVMDFELTSRNQTYVARQEAWTDGEWIYSVRVVTPENATGTLVYLLDNVAESLEPQKALANTPFSWTAYFDPQDTHVIRYPSTWNLEDSAPGRPASISGAERAVLRVEAADQVVGSADAASAWVASLRPGTNVLSVETVERGESAGYSVAYSFSTADGDTQSGLAVLLNGPNDRLHVANLRFPGSDVDLNAVTDEAVEYDEFITVMESFTVVPEWASVSTSTS